MKKLCLFAEWDFGDEGKGSFVDYLVHIENIQNIVRYNGGSQASHTVNYTKWQGPKM